jgi:methanogenic corrinoid protein MtbC1
VAHEHFASSLLEGRLLGLGRGWDRGAGPRAVLACPSGERHTLGLIAFGLALRRQGWRITYLGAETPTDHLLQAASLLGPSVLVLSAVSPQPIVEALSRLAELDGRRRVLVGGAAASSPAAAKLRWEVLGQAPVAAAAELAAAA